MKKLFLVIFLLIESFYISACSIFDENTKLTDNIETNKTNTSVVADEYFLKAMETLNKSDWKRIIRSQPEVFEMTIDGKTRECYYEGKNIICE